MSRIAFRSVLAILACSSLAALAVPTRAAGPAPKSAPAPSAATSVPEGWLLAGAAPHDYGAQVDRSTAHTGKASAVLRSIVEKPGGFGTLMQMCKGEAYRDERVRLSAWIKTENVTGWSGLWMRVDGATPREMLAFDNMESRPIKGTTPWRKYEVVLDVSQDSGDIAFGVILDGPGRVWIDDLQFEKVDTTVPTTGGAMTPALADAPRNLSFE